MAWDFETDPEFEQQLEWMRAFIDSELIPLEPILKDLSWEQQSAGLLELYKEISGLTPRSRGWRSGGP